MERRESVIGDFLGQHVTAQGNGGKCEPATVVGGNAPYRRAGFAQDGGVTFEIDVKQVVAQLRSGFHKQALAVGRPVSIERDAQSLHTNVVELPSRVQQAQKVDGGGKRVVAGDGGSEPSGEMDQSPSTLGSHGVRVSSSPMPLTGSSA